MTNAEVKAAAVRLWFFFVVVAAVAVAVQQRNESAPVEATTTEAPKDVHCPATAGCQTEGQIGFFTCVFANATTGAHNGSAGSTNHSADDRGMREMNLSVIGHPRECPLDAPVAGEDFSVTRVVVDLCGLRCFNLSRLAAVESVRLVGVSSPDGANATAGSGAGAWVDLVGGLGLAPSVIRLDLSANDVGGLSAVCGDQESDVAELDLSDNRIRELSLEQLACLPRLQALNVSHNLLTGVPTSQPPAAFPTDVRRLDLSHNAIRTLPRCVLSFLANLTVLDLSHNLMTAVLPRTFACGLGSLEVLSLAGNEIASLGEWAFTGLSNLRQLNLSQNELGSLDGASFLHVDDASGGRPPSAADGAPTARNSTAWEHFDTIDLSRNNISAVEKGWFRSAISNSRVIVLSHNRIRHFPRYGLERLPRLERLSLDDNALYWLDVGTFTSRTLKYIDLSGNKLKKIISMTFLFLPDIETVDLSHNELNYIYRVAFYKSCKHDQRFAVNLSHNYLTEDVTWALVTSFRHLITTECIVDLDVRNNRLRGLLGGAKRVYGRHLRLMDAVYFAVWDHVTLDVRDNPMACNCELANDVALLAETRKMFVGNISNAHHLDFWQGARCEGATASEATTLSRALDALTCTSLLQCPYECTCYFDRTTVVNCTRRSLIAIPYDLPPGEKRVYLAENYIMELEDGPYLDNTTFLDLSANALIDIEPEALLRLAPSATLLLHNNVLNELPATIARLAPGGRVTLRGNPISCACENWWLVEWLANHTDVVADFDNLTCDDGKHILELDAALVMAACERRSSSLFREGGMSVLYLSLATALALGFLCLVVVTLVIHSRRRILPVLMNRLSWYRLNLEREGGRDEIVLWYSPLDEQWVGDRVVEPLRRGMPLSALCPYHQCLIQDDPGEPAPDGGCPLGPVAGAKCVVVMLSENFLATEWSALDERQQRRLPDFPLAARRTPPVFFLAIEPIQLAEHRRLCDVIKQHAVYDVSEVMWLESLLDAISTLDASQDYNTDWTDEESLALRSEKH